MSSLCLMVLSVGLGQAYDRNEWLLAPQFIPGVELVYRGVCIEQNLVPGVQHQRQYDLEMILLMQNQTANFGNAVLQTSLSVKEPRNLGGKDNANAPGSVRLELVQLDRRGGLHLRPKAKKDLPDETERTLAIPLDGPPLLETGAFFEAPVVPVNLLSYWEQHEDHRPRRGWRVLKEDKCIDTSCLKLQWTQQSADWKEPRADSTAWQREDTIWFAYRDGQVFRVERVIERRDPGRTEPTQRIITKYELESRFRYVAEQGNENGARLYQDRVDEIGKFLKFQEEAIPLLQQPAQYRKNIDALLGKIATYVDANPPNYYRKAVIHLKSKLERARTGELPVHAHVASEAVEAHPLRVGIDRVPNFVIAELTCQTANNTRDFKQYLGQPVLVLYYDPTTATGKEVLLFGQKMCDKYGDDVQVLGMAVSDDLELVRRQHEGLDLSYPILDGKAMIRAFGVDATPRVVVLDSQGVLRCAFTGWGFHSPAEVDGEIDKLLRKK
jgi:hypothetical protein